MKSNHIILSFLLILAISSCKKELIADSEQYTKIYMPQAIDYPAARPMVMADTIQSFYFGASYGGVEKLSVDVTVRFKVDPAMADTFNLKNGTNYALMPQGSYELENTASIIASGQFNTPALKVKIKTIGGIEPLMQYILPVSIVENSAELTVNPKLRTTYFLIQGTYHEFSRTNWVAKEVSSQESTNPGSNVFDNNTSTNWHTQWRVAKPAHPHYIVVDMAEMHQLHGFYFWPANTANGNPEKIKIELSTDGTTWVEAGDFTLVNTFIKQNVYFNRTIQARYFKINVTSSTGNTHFTHPTEIGAF